MALRSPKSVSARSGAIQPEASGPQPPRTRVLVVDDEPSICDIIADCLRDAGYQVVATTMPLAALEAFLASRFDLVITDRDMPDINGDQVSALVKASSPETPVIMVTSHGARMGTEGGRPGRVDACIGKPFDPRSLLEAVRKVLERGTQPGSDSRCS
jgi:DNA-binding response OmpR family regulator